MIVQHRSVSKKTDTNVYIHWQSFAPKTWKIGTLRGLIQRAFVLCSTEDARKKEIAFLKKTFRGINGYPSRIVNTTIREVQQKFEQECTIQTPLAVQHLAVQPGSNLVVVDAHQTGASANSSVNATVVANNGTLLEHPASTPVVVGAHQDGTSANPTVNATVLSNADAPLEHSASSSTQNESKDFRPYLTLPYKGKEGEVVLKRLRNLLKTSMPPGVRPQFVYTGTQISSYFRVKDPVPLEHQSDLCYQ